MMPYLFLVYFISVFLSYNYISLAHSYGGRYHHCEVKVIAIFFCFFPVINTLFFSINWLLYPPTGKKFFDLDKFFNIKR